MKKKKTLTDLGYTIRDSRRVKAIEEQEKELYTAKKYLIVTGTFTLISLIFMILMWTGIRHAWFKWIMLTLATVTMFSPGWHIKEKAWQSLRRRILNLLRLLFEAEGYPGALLLLGQGITLFAGLVDYLFYTPGWPWLQLLLSHAVR